MSTQKATPKNSIESESALIAPCGMYCRLCRAYIRERKPCPGCNGSDTNKSNACLTCKIKNCQLRIYNDIKYCHKCLDFPSDKIKHIDKRYRSNYRVSMIENLLYIKEMGFSKFIKKEKEKWACPNCGEMICVHKEKCVYCGHKWR